MATQGGAKILRRNVPGFLQLGIGCAKCNFGIQLGTEGASDGAKISWTQTTHADWHFKQFIGEETYIKAYSEILEGDEDDWQCTLQKLHADVNYIGVGDKIANFAMPKEYHKSIQEMAKKAYFNGEVEKGSWHQTRYVPIDKSTGELTPSATYLHARDPSILQGPYKLSLIHI